MCSIIGYKGKNAAAPIIVNSLKRMEYRGYDSVGITTFDNGNILFRKGTGKVFEDDKQIKEELIAAGHSFASETDSEVIAHLLEIHYGSKGIKGAMIEISKHLRGNYAFVVIF